MQALNTSEPTTTINHLALIVDLARNANVFRSLLEGIDDTEVKWKPEPKKWSLLEIVCHLHDEEREDFRARVQHTLANNAEDLPPIDPEGWVTSRDYASQDYREALTRFLDERKRSIEWLRSLDHPEWKNACIHPRYGPMSAEFFLTNWVAHDILHIRQIIRTRYQYLAHSTGQILLYAGEW
jgi:hypothetical protein